MTTQYTQHGTNGLVTVPLTDLRLSGATDTNGVTPIRTDQADYVYHRVGPLVSVSFYFRWDADAADWSQGTGQLKAWLPYDPVRTTRALGEYRAGGTTVTNNPLFAHSSGFALFQTKADDVLASQDFTLVQNDYLYSAFSYLTNDDFEDVNPT